MKALAADGYILCCGLVRTLQLLWEDVCVTGADNIDEILTLIPGLPDLDLVLLDASMPGMENFAGLRRLWFACPTIRAQQTGTARSLAAQSCLSIPFSASLSCISATGPL